MPWLSGAYGNPSGHHSVAAAARTALDQARDVLAGALGTVPGDLVVTSGGTESDNLAVLGRALLVPGAVVVGAVEHHAVLNAGRAASQLTGQPLRTVGADRHGRVDLSELAKALDPTVSLVSVQLVNNELGTVQPFADVAALVRRRAPRAVLHTDAVQAAPWFDVAVLAEGADLVSISAHKFGGPQGAGALAFRRPVELAPLLHGGPQERERRAGTQNVAGAVGMAAALAAVRAAAPREAVRVAALRDRLAAGLLERVPGSVLTVGPGVPTAPGHCHVLIEGVDSEELLFMLDTMGLAASAGAACASGAMEPSHVLRAIGTAPEAARGALRLTLGHTSTDEDVEQALEVVPRAVASLRSVGASPGPLARRSA